MSLEVDLYGVIQNPFYIHGTIPSRDYIKRKKQNRKELLYREKLSGLSRKSLYLQKSFLLIQKALNLKVVTGNYSVCIYVVNSQMKTSQENLFV